MKQELDEALVRDFPNLYKQRHGKLTETALIWGFEVGDGWESIIREGSEKIEKIIVELKKTELDPDCLPCCSQVKEKYGTLRFYMHWETDEISNIIREMEDKSETTCEKCGKEGKLRSGGWYMTLCDEHNNERQK